MQKQHHVYGEMRSKWRRRKRRINEEEEEKAQEVLKNTNPSLTEKFYQQTLIKFVAIPLALISAKFYTKGVNVDDSSTRKTSSYLWQFSPTLNICRYMSYKREKFVTISFGNIYRWKRYPVPTTYFHQVQISKLRASNFCANQVSPTTCGR